MFSINKQMSDSILKKDEPSKMQTAILLDKVLLFVIINLMGLYCAWLVLTFQMKFYTFLFYFIVALLGGLGVTGGAHRLWAHRSYKAKPPLKIIYVIFNCLASQADVITWAKDHRTHHKFCDTDADPYNAKRGFLFSHIGWLCQRKHPDVIEKGKTLDYSDLYSDPILLFQKKYYVYLTLLISWVIPVVVPIYFWNETFLCAVFGNAGRLGVILHVTFMVNSVAHIYGNRPYEKDVSASENSLVSFLSGGEGWHNFHHAFPWDYKAGELGNRLNLTTAFIHMFAKIGWAYDLKTVNEDLLRKRICRTGDGSHKVHKLEQ